MICNGGGVCGGLIEPSLVVPFSLHLLRGGVCVCVRAYDSCAICLLMYACQLFTLSLCLPTVPQLSVHVDNVVCVCGVFCCMCVCVGVCEY